MTVAMSNEGDDFELRMALIAEAKAVGFKVDDDWTHCVYRQNTNDDAKTDAWLASGTSYIWRVGVLTIWDANKCDQCGVVFGHRREPGYDHQVIGWANWSEGENDDPARTWQRVIDLAAETHPVFHNDDN